MSVLTTLSGLLNAKGPKQKVAEGNPDPEWSMRHDGNMIAQTHGFTALVFCDDEGWRFIITNEAEPEVRIAQSDKRASERFENLRIAKARAETSLIRAVLEDASKIN